MLSPNDYAKKCRHIVILYLCQFSSTDQEELETDSTVREILDDTNEEVQDVDNILFDMFLKLQK